MIDTVRLREIISKRGLSQRKVAHNLGITEKTFYAKMKKGVFDSDEMTEMVSLLRIQNPSEIFFAGIGTQHAPIEQHDTVGESMPTTCPAP